MRRDWLHNRLLKISYVDRGTMKVRNRLTKTGKMICVDGRTFQIVAVIKNSSLKFRTFGSGKVILLGHM